MKTMEKVRPVTMNRKGVTFVSSLREQSIYEINMDKIALKESYNVSESPAIKSMAYDHENDILYISDHIEGTITAIHEGHQEVLISNLGIPVMIALDETNRLYVSDYELDGIAIIDIAKKKIIKTIKTGSHPEGISVSNNLIAVCNSNDNTVSLINKDNYEIETIKVGRTPKGIISTTNYLYVINYDDSTLNKIDLNNKEVGIVKLKGKKPKQMVHDEDNIYIVMYQTDQLIVFNKETEEQTVIGGLSSPCSVTQNEDYIFVANEGNKTISILQKKNISIIDNIHLNSKPEFIIRK